MAVSIRRREPSAAIAKRATATPLRGRYRQSRRVTPISYWVYPDGKLWEGQCACTHENMLISTSPERYAACEEGIALTGICHVAAGRNNIRLLVGQVRLEKASGRIRPRRRCIAREAGTQGRRAAGGFALGQRAVDDHERGRGREKERLYVYT